MRMGSTKIEHRKPEEVLRPLSRFDFIQELYDFLEPRLEEKFPRIHLTHNEIWEGTGEGFLSVRVGSKNNDLTKADLYILDHNTFVPVLEFFLEPSGHNGGLEGRIVITGIKDEYIELTKDLISRFIAKTPEAVLQAIPIEVTERLPSPQFATLSAREQFEVTALLAQVKNDLIVSIKKSVPESSIEIMGDLRKRGISRYRIYDRYKLEDGNVVDCWIAIFDSERALDVAEIRVHSKKKVFRKETEIKAVLVQFEVADPVIAAIEDFTQNYDIRLAIQKLNYSEHEKLLERLKSINPKECIQAMTEVKDSDDPIILDAVVNCLDSLLVQVREEAAKFFISRSDMLALHAVRRGASSSATSLRTRCLDFLAGKTTISNETNNSVKPCAISSVATWIKDLNDYLRVKRDAAKQNLLANLDYALPFLISEIQTNPNRRIIEECLEIISNSDDTRAGEALLIASQSKDTLIKSTADAAMKKRAYRMR